MKNWTSIWAAEVPSQTCLPRAFLDTLDEDELDHCRHLAKESSRLRFIVGRVMLRRMLGKWFDQRPEHWHFDADDWGKPRLLDQFGLSDLDFSVSHSGNAVVVAISWGFRCGVDVEKIDAKIWNHPIDEVFNPLEREMLARYGSDQDYLIRLWTAKEAYAKMVGLGFFLDFSSFAISLEPMKLVLSERGVKNPEGVSLMGFEFELGGKNYATTLAVRTPPGTTLSADFKLVDREGEPLSKSVQPRQPSEGSVNVLDHLKTPGATGQEYFRPGL